MNEIEFLELFSTNLKRIMEEDKITQEELANEVGISRYMISRYISGQSMPSGLTLVNIAEALFCSVDELLKEE